MTNEEVAAVLSAGRGRAIARLAGLRRSDLENIASERGVSFTREEPPGRIARRVVDHVVQRAQERASRGRSRT